jgi:hypothetical protein
VWRRLEDRQEGQEIKSGPRDAVATHHVRNAGTVDDQAGFGLGSDAHPGTKAEPILVRICPSKSVAWGVVRQRHW